MKLLMITGDRSFGPGHPRYEMHRAALVDISVVYWGRGSFFPKIPKEKFDAVTAQDPFWRGLFAWYVSRRIGAAFNGQVHADLDGQSLPRHLLAQVVLRHADSVRVVSERIKKQVERMGVRAPVHVLPVFVDAQKFNGLAHVPQSKKTIFWVGRFEDEKDPLLAIEVLKTVRSAGADAVLIMLGKGSLDGALRAKVSRLSLESVVEFPGWQDPLPFYARADVVLSTSRHESYGASIVEALAAGVPVVAPDVGIAREAGATVVPREKLAEAAINALQRGERGVLKLPILSEREYSGRLKELYII